MANKDNRTMLIIGVLLLGLVYLMVSGRGTSISEEHNENWKEDYQYEADLSGITNVDYFSHNYIINTNEEIQQVADYISSQSGSAKEAVKLTLDYVYSGVIYSRKTTVSECTDESAIDVLEQGYGDCVSMTKLLVSLLRAQGIASRPTGGCISSTFSCGVIYSTHPNRLPQYEEVNLEDPKKRGGLHEWAEIWLPDEGWVIGEATSGQLFKRSCISYDIHDYNTDEKGMCVITDTGYIRQCARY